MKALLVIFALCINYILCDKVAIKSYPKKVRPYGNGKILINSAKYEFKAKNNKPTTTGLKTYTVFQVVGIPKTIQGVPDSPYFPIEQGYDHKPRVKKVLPDYGWSSIRNKRAVVFNETDKKDDKVETATPGQTKVSTTAPDIAKDTPKSTGETKTETSKTVERAGNEATTKTEKAVSVKKDADKKVEPKIIQLKSASNNKKPQQRSDANLDRKIIPESRSNKDAKTPKRTSKDNVKSPAAVKAKAKPKENKKTAVASVRAKSGNGTNAKARKGASKTRTKTGGSKKKSKKRTGKTAAKKNNKTASQRTKNRSRSKKGKSSKRSKPANGTNAGKPPKAERRLIAAREALIEDYPYVVSIQKDDQHWCSGALLNPRLVITTANCLWKANRISRMEVRAGSRHVDRGGQVAGIQEVMKHPGWGLRKNPDNDVALILLDRNIKFSHDVHGVDIPNRVMMPAFDDAWVTSWGAERRDGVYDTDSTSLQVFHTRLMDREKCNNVTMRFSVIVSENFICLSQSGKTAPCTRDTGAPAVSDGILWGLASWGIRKLCGTERFPAMFSYLASHSNLDFITNATHYLMADQRHYPYADRYPDIRQKS